MAEREVPEDDFEELRFALVLNGGVSLAVWIGGVALEFNRLVRGEGEYRDILRATATRASVDVVSGTSAGGINGAFLALSCVCGTSLRSLRKLWLDNGDIDALLRAPGEKDPRSLLRGNEYFLPELRRAFRGIDSRQHLASVQQVPMSLTLTTTLLHGQSRTFSDDLGAAISDVNHRAQFRFRRTSENDPFKDVYIADRLAFAARATASFPVAFEPVFYPASNPDLAHAPHVADTVNLTQDRFLLDGGILDNKPLEAALDAILVTPADVEVRRVLAYVVPNPGATAKDEKDDPDELPGLAPVALASLIEVPRIESISAQLETVLRHNEQVRTIHRSRSNLMVLGMQPLSLLSTQLFQVYRDRRLEGAADYILIEAAAGFAAESKGKRGVGRRLKGWLTGKLLEQRDAVPWVPTFAPSSSNALAERQHWRWGVYTLQHIAETVLDLIRGLQRLVSLERDAEIRKHLRKLKGDAFETYLQIIARRAKDKEFWRGWGEELYEILEMEAESTNLGAAVTESILRALDDWKGQFSHDADAELATAVASHLVQGAELFRQNFPEVVDWLRPEDVTAHKSLLRSFSVMAPSAASTEDVLTNLLVLEVALGAFMTQRDLRDQYVELVQISADAPTSFPGAIGAAEKLAGAQIANFGAFLKKSWRANDWMFGRLDGADRLSRVLLNPDRFRRLYSNYGSTRRANGAAAAAAVIKDLAVPADPSPDRQFLLQKWVGDEQAITKELSFLDDSEVPIPEQLPYCAGAVCRRMQLGILREELGCVADAVAEDEDRGASPATNGSKFRRAFDRETERAPGGVFDAATVVELFSGCRIGSERAVDEVGSDMFTAVAARAFAVTAAAGAGEQSKLGPIRKLFAVVRVPALAADFFARGMLKRSRTAAALHAASLAFGASLVALGLTYAKDMPGYLLTAGGVLLAGSVFVAFLKSRKWAIGCIVVAAFPMLATLLLPKLPGIGAVPNWLRAVTVGLFLLAACVLIWVMGKKHEIVSDDSNRVKGRKRAIFQFRRAVEKDRAMNPSANPSDAAN